MNIRKQVLKSVYTLIRNDKKHISYLLYYTILEGILAMSIPLASSFIINSILAHATISIMVVAFLVIIIVLLTTFLHVVKEYIIEKLQQKIFIDTAANIAIMANTMKGDAHSSTTDKYMNYFFDITAIQKLFPILLLDGSSLLVKLIVSLVLFLIFDGILFAMGIFFLLLFIIIIILLGRNGADYAIERSDAKHKTIYYLQSIPEIKENKQNILSTFDALLDEFMSTRERIFKVIIRQLAFTYFMEGLIFGTFLIAGGFMVINGTLPIGEFIAMEIAVVYLTYALRSFMKHIDYIYDVIEGVYKVDKLSSHLKKATNE